MIPRDSFNLFRVIETNITVGVSTVVQLLNLNPDRWLAVVSTDNNALFGISSSSLPTATKRMVVGTGMQPLVMSFNEWGPLVGREWFGQAAAGQNFTVFEAIMDREPSTVVSYRGDSGKTLLSTILPPYNGGGGGGIDRSQPPASGADPFSALRQRLRSLLQGDSNSPEWYPNSKWKPSGHSGG